MKLIEALMTAAVRAPSGDNTQPWRFSVDSGRGRIAIDVDPARDPSPMNAGQRMSRIAVGAALENMLRTLDKNRATADWSVDPGTAAVSLSFTSSEESAGRDDEAGVR